LPIPCAQFEGCGGAFDHEAELAEFENIELGASFDELVEGAAKVAPMLTGQSKKSSHYGERSGRTGLAVKGAAQLIIGSPEAVKRDIRDNP
jgi:hypothetical protein